VPGVPPASVEIRVKLCYNERHKLGAFACPAGIWSESQESSNESTRTRQAVRDDVYRNRDRFITTRYWLVRGCGGRPAGVVGIWLAEGKGLRTDIISIIAGLCASDVAKPLPCEQSARKLNIARDGRRPSAYLHSALQLCNVSQPQATSYPRTRCMPRHTRIFSLSL
jgi:hypothetical protein